MYAGGSTTRQIAALFSISKSTIVGVVARKRWAAIPPTEAEQAAAATKAAALEERSTPTMPLFQSVLFPDLYTTVTGDVWRDGKWRLKAYKNAHGYMQLNYRGIGATVNPMVHRVVASAFYPEADFSLFVDHKDFDKTNNHAENLEWVTPKENTRRANVGGRLHKGEQAKMSRLKEDDILEICRLRAAGVPQRQIAAQFNIAESAITKIKQRKAWGHVKREIEEFPPQDQTGAKNSNAKLTTAQVMDIRARVGISYGKLAVEFGVTKRCIGDIRQNRTWVRSTSWPEETQTPDVASPRAKLTDALVLQIRARLAAGDTQDGVAAAYGVSQSSVSLISLGETWRHLLPDTEERGTNV